jgi:hypothetical protein
MRTRTTRLHFVISIGIHLLFLLAWVITESVMHTPLKKAQKDKKDDDRFVFEVVETPDFLPDEKPEAETNLVSDKNTRAADEEPPTVNSLDIPYSPGEFIFKMHELPESEKQEAGGAETPEVDLGDLAEAGGPGESGAQQDYEIPAHSVAFQNLVSSLSRHGGMSFNTYAWDFAPYMLAMKRKVEKNLHPPYAFTHMGMVSGTTLVRFTVHRDGSVSGLTILGSDAHFSLDRTSVRAIELSMPFLPLPADFPEDVLEVTAQFSYLLTRGADTGRR